MAERVRLADIRERAELVRGLNATPVVRDLIRDHVAMLAALDAIAALHKPEVDRNWPNATEHCEHCCDEWPCPTVRAIESVIDPGGSRE